VQAVIYLIFNEGYTASTGDGLVRGDLCAEAIRLARVLCDLMPGEPENLGLPILMLLHDSRRDARMVNGALVTLEDQDRSLWDRGAIAEGLALLERALQMVRGAGAGPYLLQAAIAALHSSAPDADATDWPQIAALYEKLLAVSPSPVIALNLAVAVAMAHGYELGLGRIDAPARSLDSYYLFHAARADLLRRLGRWAEAAAAYRRAVGLAANRVEREFSKETAEGGGRRGGGDIRSNSGSLLEPPGDWTPLSASQPCLSGSSFCSNRRAFAWPLSTALASHFLA